MRYVILVNFLFYLVFWYTPTVPRSGLSKREDRVAFDIFLCSPGVAISVVRLLIRLRSSQRERPPPPAPPPRLGGRLLGINVRKTYRRKYRREKAK